MKHLERLINLHIDQKKDWTSETFAMVREFNNLRKYLCKEYHEENCTKCSLEDFVKYQSGLSPLVNDGWN